MTTCFVYLKHELIFSNVQRIFVHNNLNLSARNAFTPPETRSDALIQACLQLII